MIDSERPTMREVTEAVCKKHGITPREMFGPSKTRRVTRPRQEAYWRCAKESGASLTKIALFFKRHHTSCLHGIREHAKRMGFVPRNQ